MSEFGRIDDDGTVYVRTADGERAVGSWQAGTPEEGLAHFARRYEVHLDRGGPARAAAARPARATRSRSRRAPTRLKSTIPTAAAVGDLAALERRVDALLEKTADAVEAGKAAKAEARARAGGGQGGARRGGRAAGRHVGVEGRGERLRTLGDDWKRLPHLDRKAEDELWQRIAAARKRFTERRTDPLRRPRAAAHGLAGAQGEAHQGGRGAVDLDRVGPDRGPLQAADDRVEDRRPRAARGRGRALEPLQGRAGRVLHRPQRPLLRPGRGAARQPEGQGGDPRRGRDHRPVAGPRQGQGPAAHAAGPLGGRRQGPARRHALARGPHGRRRGRRSAPPASSASRRSDESPFTAKLREKVVELEAKLDKARAAGRPTEELEAASPPSGSGWRRPAAAPARTSAPAAPAAPSAAPAKKRRRAAGSAPSSTHADVRQEAEPPGSAPVRVRATTTLARRNSTVRDQASSASVLRVGAERVRVVVEGVRRRRRSGTPPRRRTRVRICSSCARASSAG